MELVNEKKLKKVERVYLFLGDRGEWCADTKERKWFGGLAIRNDEFKTLNFGKFIDVDFELKKFIKELSGNDDELYGAESYFLERDIKNIINICYLSEINSEINIEGLKNFINGYELAKEYCKYNE